MTTRSIRLYIWTGLTAALVLFASPAHAQYKPQPLDEPATGEKFHIEGNASWWFPSAAVTVASEGFGISGSAIDFKNDLGIEDKRMTALSLTLRPSRSQKFRFQTIPIRYEAASVLRREIVFNGQKYQVNLPVKSTLDWKAYRFGYEYDFVTKNRGFAGFIFDVKYTDVQVQIQAGTSSTSIDEFARSQLPLPAIGGIGRFYVVPNISITGEVTAFKLPDSIDSRYGGHYVDIDIYGTVNFTNNVGAQVGYRSLDMGYLVKKDTGSFVLKGLYFGLVARY
jgi:hypothetical protein